MAIWFSLAAYHFRFYSHPNCSIWRIKMNFFQEDDICPKTYRLDFACVQYNNFYTFFFNKESLKKSRNQWNEQIERNIQEKWTSNMCNSCFKNWILHNFIEKKNRVFHCQNSISIAHTPNSDIKSRWFFFKNSSKLISLSWIDSCLRK